MNRELRGVAAGLVTVAVGAAGAALVGRSLWSRTTSRMVARLGSAPAEPTGGSFQVEHLAALPPPVRRYFEFALTPGQPLIRHARIEHVGEFRTDFEAGWSPFWSTQHYSVGPPGFVWDACIGVTPFGNVRVRDTYLAGEATLVAKLGGWIRVAENRGSQELASSALHRYLAEAVWLPTALLPGAGVTWAATGETTARATLVDSGIEASLEFHFSRSGKVERVTGERYRMVDGTGVLTRFVGEFGEYAEADGMRIPIEGEVEWALPEGRLSYWMGRVVGAEYESATGSRLPAPPFSGGRQPSTFIAPSEHRPELTENSGNE